MNAAAPDKPLLEIERLEVEFDTRRGVVRGLRGVDLAIGRGETLAIVGESGSGKSVTAQAVMGLIDVPGRITGGDIRWKGHSLLSRSGARMARDLRGKEIALVFQDPMTSLNPLMKVGAQISEVLRRHLGMTRADADLRVLELLEAVGIPAPPRRAGQYPHELSGGMRQRVMIAMAIAGEPKLLIADEPTTALDVTVQAQILELIRNLQRAAGTAVVLITHDMGVVAEMADRVIVMNGGRMVEAGGTGQIFAAPRDDYTRMLLAAVPRLGAAPPRPEPTGRAGDAVVTVRDLTVGFDILGGLLRRPVERVHAVEGLSFDVRRGETLALVGESGCGKSTTGRALLSLVRWQGEIAIDGRSTAGLGRHAMKPVRRDIQMIFQDPYASLDPRMTVGELVGEPMVVHGIARGSELRDRVAGLFRRVGLTPDQMRRHPHEFSGGQRQRICIARALSLSPKVIVADESVSALDVSVQARVLALLDELQAELGLSYVFISHDMAVVEQVSHRIAVMYLGQIVEMGSREQVLRDPRHRYTRRLLEAVLVPDPARRRGSFAIPDGDVPSPIRPVGLPPERLPLADVGDGHLVAA